MLLYQLILKNPLVDVSVVVTHLNCSDINSRVAGYFYVMSANKSQRTHIITAAVVTCDEMQAMYEAFYWQFMNRNKTDIGIFVHL